MKSTSILRSAMAFAALATLPGIAAEQTLNVTSVVSIDPFDVVISGIDDLSINISEVPEFPSTQPPVASFDEFCLFSPTRFFSMTLTGANTNALGRFVLVDNAQSDANLRELEYQVGVLNIFTDINSPEPLQAGGLFDNGVTVSRIDSDPFNNDATCTDGNNLAIFAQIGQGLDNQDVLAQIADGQPHTYTDTLTIVVEPDL